jgi:hypothetical protein
MHSFNEDPIETEDALPNIVFYRGEHHFNVWTTLSSNLAFLDEKPEDTTHIDTPKDGKVLVLRTEVSVGHILNDTIYTMVLYNKVFPDHKIIILVPFSNSGLYSPHDGSRSSFVQNDSVWDFIEKVAESQGIDLQIIHFPSYHNANISIENFYAISSDPFGTMVQGNRLGYLELRDATRKAVASDEVPVNRKVYVSRSKTRPRLSHAFLNTGAPKAVKSRVMDDRRVFKEEFLDDLFSKLGFEVAYVEELDTYEQQVKMFSGASVIAGVTGAGLNNMTFMPPGSTVIEVSTPIWAVGTVNLHNVYKTMASYLDHIYLSIPAIESRDGEAVSINIEKNSNLCNFLKEL